MTVRIACPLRGAHCSLSGVGRASFRGPPDHPDRLPAIPRVEADPHHHPLIAVSSACHASVREPCG
jgi:hypothetical protein